MTKESCYSRPAYRAQREKVLGLIRSGIDSGARLVTGGGIFGPVLTVTAYDTEDDAVAIANNRRNGDEGFREYLQGKMIGLPE